MGPRWKGKGAGAEAEAKALTNSMSQIVSQLKSSIIRSGGCGLLAVCCVVVAVEAEICYLLHRSCFGMVFFFWTRPSTQDQKICIEKAGPLNYKSKYKGATANSAPTLKEDTELLKDGFFTNHARVLVGSGFETYERGKTALQNWRHFGLNWAFVESTTQIQNGVSFCVCTKEFVPWLVMPLQVVYVTETRNKKNGIASYRFGSGTLGGHLLAGEERFSVELDEDNQVWYEILSFSKPAHFLSYIGYPYVQLKQKLFANQSANAMLNYLKAS